MENKFNMTEIKFSGGRLGDAPLHASTEESAVGTEPSEPEEWKPSRGEWLIFLCLSIISLIVSLDSSIIGPVLPVSALPPLIHFYLTLTLTLRIQFRLSPKVLTETPTKPSGQGLPTS